MRIDLVSVLIFWSAVALAGCSPDTTLFRDYKLYDLDGSNQTIMGNRGMLAVSNVTALALEKPLIFVEVEGEYLPPEPGRNCSYKVIDTCGHSMTDLPAGTPAHQIAVAAIKAQPQYVVSRSCAMQR